MEIFVNCIGGSGPRCGKDTLAKFGAEYICQQNVKNKNSRHISIQINLADALKVQYANLHNIDIDDLYDTKKKEQHRPGLIRFGAEKRRENRWYWSEAAIKHFFQSKILDMNSDYVSLFIPDVRYTQEFDVPVFIHEGMKFDHRKFHITLNSVYVHVPDDLLRKRMSVDSDQAFYKIIHDASETCLGPEDFSRVVDNSRSLGEFQASCNELFTYWYRRVL